MCLAYAKQDGLNKTSKPPLMDTFDGHLLLFSGKPTNKPSSSGVDILLSRDSSKGLVSWKPVSNRVMWIRLKTKIRNSTFVQCYAPTEVSDIETNQELYEQLVATSKDLHRSDIVILMGDFNAKVGQDNTD